MIFLNLAWLASATAAAAERGALFRLSAHGHSMYLFGTMHVGLPAFYPLEPRIAEAVANAPVLALELDPDPAPAAAGRAVAQHGMLSKEAAAGYAKLPPQKRALLDDDIRQAGLDPQGARKLKPVLLAALLSVAEYQKLGYRADLSADRELARLAREHNVPVMELESLEGQLAMLDQLPPADQWIFLTECLDSIESGAQLKEARTVVAAWGSADRAALDAVAQRTAADTSVSGGFTRDVLLNGRNTVLAGKLDDLLQKENGAVVAIGVLHLLGDRSVPALLAARGISVERVY
ncbi:MAG: TraB/GumN family protein [Telluria sp.]